MTSETMGSNRVLVVDDAMIMRARIKSIAKEAGWEIAGEARNGAEAVEKYAELTPDLVTLDIVMPEKDGVQALKEIIDADSNARVVMVTAVNQREKLNECIQSGAIDFIVKPFEKEVLRSFFDKYNATTNS